jgi:tellurite resistance protein
VYDEAHRAVARGTWRVLSNILGTQQIPFLGLTATPFRRERGGTERLQEQLGRSIYHRTFKDLIDIGFLAKPVFKRQQLRSTDSFVIRESEQEEIRRSQEITPTILGKLAREPRRNREIIDHWMRERHIYGKTLVFACNVEHADNLAKMFCAHDVRADSLHSDLPAQERAKRLRSFREGDVDVLVNVGILTEGANVPDTKTVLMARPTLSTSLYMQMIGRAARGPRAVPGKTQFYVIDCVDNFSLHGLTLAGTTVAKELTPEAAIPRAPGGRPRSAAEERTERRELTRAAAWLAARGYDPRSYSFWGELRWESASGPASVAVFTETYAPVEEAVRLVRDAVATGRWDLARSQGPLLESFAALRAVDWGRLVGDCERMRLAPQLIPVVDLKLTEEDLEAAEQIQRLVALIRVQGFDAAMLAADQAWGQHEVLRKRWASSMDFRHEVMAAASNQVQAAATGSASQAGNAGGLEGFVEVALGVARADGFVDNSERLALLRGAERLLSSQRSVDGQVAQSMLDAKERVTTLDIHRGLFLMRKAFDWSTRLVAFDLLFRVALADGRLADEERALLEQCAAGLELPNEELAERLQWFQPSRPAPVAAVFDGYRTCPSCSATFEGAPNYCGYCGTSMALPR